MQLFIPIILVVVAVGLFITGIDPKYEYIKTQQKEQAGYNEILAQTVEIREFRKGVQSKYNAIDDRDLDRLEKMLPTHIDNIRLILDINNVANKRQMTIQDIQVNLDKGLSEEDSFIGDINQYETVGFSFTVVTTYENFKDFLEDLALSLRIIDVESIEISNIEGEKDFYRFNVGIATYWLPK